jgi:hypothetical protein
MATNKAPSPDGFIIEFYIKYWPLIGSDYTQMVHDAIQRGYFPQGVNKGLLALLHKGNATDDLANWRPISLLNVAYKIMANALQRRLQPLLSEVISPDQTAFVPNRYILDNVLVLQESIAWAQETEQDMALFKLDFKKAYDTVHLPGLLRIMQAFGIPGHFLHMVQLLFTGTSAFVGLNGRESEVFEVQRGVRKGCPPAPYLFSICRRNS